MFRRSIIHSTHLKETGQLKVPAPSAFYLYSNSENVVVVNNLAASLLLLAPLVLLPDLLLLAGGEVVLDVEGLADLLGGLALDHVGHRLAGDVQQALDVEVVGGQDQLEEGALENIKTRFIPNLSMGERSYKDIEDKERA